MPINRVCCYLGGHFWSSLDIRDALLHFKEDTGEITVYQERSGRDRHGSAHRVKRNRACLLSADQ